MRELKFRAWRNIDGRLRRYVFSPFAYEYPEPDEPVFHAEHDVNDIRDFMPLADIIEQYTGLKDKNGKEIYEGDIVKYAWTRCNYIVAYRKYDASFVLENDDREEIILFQYNRQNDYEVIGTIHEKPELLGGEE